MRNKKLYIIITTIIVILLILFIAIKIRNKKRIQNLDFILPTINLDEVFELQDISNTKYDIKKSNNEIIAKKYIATEKSVLNADVEFNNRKGKMIYVRDANNKMNVYQTKYRIDDLDYTNGINKYINEFLENVSTYIGANQLQIYDGILFGKEMIPQYLEEKIYKDKDLYTFKYEQERENTNDFDIKDTKKYDINFYMEGNYLMCELVLIY